MKIRKSCSVSRRPRMCSLDFSTNMTFPSISRFRGNDKPAFMYSILMLLSDMSENHREKISIILLLFQRKSYKIVQCQPNIMREKNKSTFYVPLAQKFADFLKNTNEYEMISWIFAMLLTITSTLKIIISHLGRIVR